MRHARTFGPYVGGTAAHRHAIRHSDPRPPGRVGPNRPEPRMFGPAYHDPVGYHPVRRTVAVAAVAAARFPTHAVHPAQPRIHPTPPDDRPTLAETLTVALFVVFVFAAFALTVYQLVRRTAPNGPPPMLDPPPLVLAMDALG